LDIRLANSTDFQQCLLFVNSLLEELGGKQLALNTAHLVFSRLAENQDEGYILVGEEDGRVVGVCTVSFQYAIRTAGRYAIIQEMYVIPELRSLGIGTKLIQQAILEAQNRGCTAVELGTPTNGFRQEKLYQRLGFNPVGLRLRRTLNV